MSDIWKLADQLTESDAWDLFHDLRRKHGWQGTVFGEIDIQDMWDELRRAEGMECGEPWVKVRDNVLAGRGWTRWFTEWLVEKGNEYLADWILELDDEGKEQVFE